MESSYFRDKMRFGGNREKAILRDGGKCTECGITREEHKKKYNKPRPEMRHKHSFTDEAVDVKDSSHRLFFCKCGASSRNRSREEDRMEIRGDVENEAKEIVHPYAYAIQGISYEKIIKRIAEILHSRNKRIEEFKREIENSVFVIEMRDERISELEAKLKKYEGICYDDPCDLHNAKDLEKIQELESIISDLQAGARDRAKEAEFNEEVIKQMAADNVKMSRQVEEEKEKVREWRLLKHADLIENLQRLNTTLQEIDNMHHEEIKRLQSRIKVYEEVCRQVLECGNCEHCKVYAKQALKTKEAV